MVKWLERLLAEQEDPVSIPAHKNYLRHTYLKSMRLMDLTFHRGLVILAWIVRVWETGAAVVYSNLYMLLKSEITGLN